jgi:transcription elongation factor Elf1
MAAPSTPPDYDPHRRALFKRGFRQTDPYLHPCPACKVQKSVEKWVLFGKSGGRDIDVCGACGKSWSWRHRPPSQDRDEDVGFDLTTFLKL